jgi:hypothetical protein
MTPQTYEAIHDWPDPAWIVGDTTVDIALKYDGLIPSGQQRGGQSDLKQVIRKQFSKQLGKQWEKETILRGFYDAGLPLIGNFIKNQPCQGSDECPFFRVPVCGFHAIPLISWHNRLGVELDIVFWGESRRVLQSGGDLDNRLKTLFDALRIPQGPNEVLGTMCGNGSEEIFCLLEDDSLISKFCVEAREGFGSPLEYETVIKVRIVAQNNFHPTLRDFR